MGVALNSLDGKIFMAQNYGVLTRLLHLISAGTTTAATNTSGKVSMHQILPRFTVPSFGSGVNSAILTEFKHLSNVTSRQPLVGIDYLLGSINMNTGTFTDGVAMPVKSIFGSNLQTATDLAYIVATATHTATTPVVTVTYTDQDGNAGNSAALTLPTNAAVGSAFLINPHLASGDSGIRDVTNITKSAGTAGTCEVRGLLLLDSLDESLVALPETAGKPYMPYPIAAGETLGFYAMGAGSAYRVNVHIAMVGDQ